MDNREVISKLREHRDELTAAGSSTYACSALLPEEKRTIRPMSI
jgi:hypothetical protein